MDDIVFSSVRTIARAIRDREVSSEEVVRAHLERIDEVNPVLNAVVHICGDRALEEARKADEAVSSGADLGPLHGVPMTIKDSLDTAGVRTTAATVGRRDDVPSEDATCVARMRQAGAILLGKSNTPEFTLSGETDNLVYGRTNNPYDPSLMPGGSSGGAAASIAAGCSPMDLGSDTGGSVRLPSHFCGIAGLKPNSYRVPRTGHAIHHAMGALDSLTQNGPMARFVDDLYPRLSVISGPDWRDPGIVPAPLYDPADVDVTTLRVAMHTDNGVFAPTAETAETVRAAARCLADAGVHVEEERPEPIAQHPNLFGRLFNADGGAWVQRLLDSAGTAEASPFVERRLDPAQALDTASFTALLEELDAYRSAMLGFIRQYDAILCPTCAFPATEHGGTVYNESRRGGFSYTSAYNMTGWPGVTVRGGTSPDGLPISVQVVARSWREDVALALAKVVEDGLGGWQRPQLP